MKKIVKRIARWILREELQQTSESYQTEIERLRNLAFGKRKILINQTMLECIVKMLPDPNRAGNGGLTASDLNIRSMKFVDTLRGQRYEHSIKFVKAIGDDKGLQGLTMNISDYNINVFVPLRRENVSYEIYGVQSSIDTYFWDFYGAGIRMISNEAWTMATEFINAQNNAMKELREEGLL